MSILTRCKEWLSIMFRSYNDIGPFSLEVPDNAYMPLLSRKADRYIPSSCYKGRVGAAPQKKLNNLQMPARGGRGQTSPPHCVLGVDVLALIH
jgi:hypothetical protein